MSVRARLSAQVEADLRLAILQILAAGGGDLNNRILRAALADLGHRPSADAQRSAVAWLEEQRLISSETVSEAVQRLRITERGLDAAEGRASVPGVARPRPGDGA